MLHKKNISSNVSLFAHFKKHRKYGNVSSFAGPIILKKDLQVIEVKYVKRPLRECFAPTIVHTASDKVIFRHSTLNDRESVIITLRYHQMSFLKLEGTC